MIEECRGRDYEMRLGLIGLITLETRALWADMLEVFIIMNKIEGMKEENFFIRDLKGGRDILSNYSRRGFDWMLLDLALVIGCALSGTTCLRQS